MAIAIIRKAANSAEKNTFKYMYIWYLRFLFTKKHTSTYMLNHAGITLDTLVHLFKKVIASKYSPHR